mmetsp:Transcript_62491/g.135659  ORF Transcript_62491/g.135659 Transcript_62491/m.135659 type:complete len:201 (-) Transcript_62491:800-1402(-)
MVPVSVAQHRYSGIRVCVLPHDLLNRLDAPSVELALSTDGILASTFSKVYNEIVSCPALPSGPVWRASSPSAPTAVPSPSFRAALSGVAGLVPQDQLPQMRGGLTAISIQLDAHFTSYGRAADELLGSTAMPSPIQVDLHWQTSDPLCAEKALVGFHTLAKLRQRRQLLLQQLSRFYRHPRQRCTEVLVLHQQTFDIRAD